MDNGIGIALSFLLPAGLWLVLTAAAPREQENNAAASGMLAIAISTLAFFAFGFAMLAGGVGATLNLKQFVALTSYASLPLNGQTWGIIGLRGFALANTGLNELLLCLAYLPMAQTAAVLAVSALHRRVNFPGQALAAFLAGGLLTPIAGFWVWGGGWLAQLGAGASLGHGAVDLSGITLAALVAGALATIWLTRVPHANQPAILPEAGMPSRAFAGMVFVWVGLMAFANASPLLKSLGPNAPTGLAINSAAAVAGGVIMGMGYAAFVSRRADVLLAVRAGLAALICVAASGATLPPVLAMLMGLAMGIFVPVLDFAIKRQFHLPDDEFAISTIFLPALLGMMLPGLLAQGNIGAGWNGVGAESYLGAKGLGIVGLFSQTSAPDVGQLSAQVIAVISICVVCGAIGFVFGRVFKPLQVTSAVQITKKKSAAPAITPEPEEIYMPPQEQMALPVEIELLERSDSASAPKQDEQPGEGVFARLRRMQAERNKPAAPAQARKVAYPTRVGGRRLFTRPLAEEKNSELE